MKTMTDLDLSNKRVLIRQDLNVPMEGGQIRHDARIRSALTTIQQALEAGAAVMVMSHLGRPKPGQDNSHLSLQPIAERMQALLGRPVRFEKDWLTGVTLEPKEVVLLENTRFNQEETDNDQNLAQQMAQLCDVFVMDAFATAHRSEASTVGVAQYAQQACAGPLLMQEISLLEQVLNRPQRPLAAVVGGSKVSTKLNVLKTLADKVDLLLLGGGILNTFLKAQGYAIGDSLYEAGLLNEAQHIIQRIEQQGGQIAHPQDVVVAGELSAEAQTTQKLLTNIDSHDKILDIGDQARLTYSHCLQQAATIIWNGPLGAFEIPAFAGGTQAVGHTIAECSRHDKTLAIAGGGDTLAALEQYAIDPGHMHLCTGGSAFLAYMAGEPLPAIAALNR